VATRIKTKKRGCKSGPRSKRCPVVCKRLEALGYTQREDKRTWHMIVIPPKKVFRAARA